MKRTGFLPTTAFLGSGPPRRGGVSPGVVYRRTPRLDWHSVVLRPPIPRSANHRRSLAEPPNRHFQCLDERLDAFGAEKSTPMIRNWIPVPGTREVFAEGPERPAGLAYAKKPPHPPWRHKKRPKPLPNGSREEAPAGNAGADQPIPLPEAPQTASRRPGILVVDDDTDVRALLQAVLDQQGFVVWAAASGRQALELYQEWRSAIDLVLLDVCMAGLDGPQTLVGLRRLNPALCCCFMTGDAGRYTLDDLMAQGVRHVFQKPFRPFEVAQILRQLVDPLGCVTRAAMARSSYAGSLPELFLG